MHELQQLWALKHGGVLLPAGAHGGQGVKRGSHAHCIKLLQVLLHDTYHIL